MLQGKHRYRCIQRLNSGTFGFVKLAIDVNTGTDNMVTSTWSGPYAAGRRFLTPSLAYAYTHRLFRPWERRAGKKCAVKFLDRGEKVSKYVEREILNHRRLVHPHIIRFKEVILTDVYICIVMEYAEGGDMFDYVLKRGGLREHEARWFFQQLIVATDYIHQMGMANRDIKLENTLLDVSPKPLIKLCDFGYSKHEKLQSAPGSRVGTPAYLAPEVISTLKGDTYDGKIADIWSCGVMLYVMLTGSYPFERQGDKTSASKLQLMIARILKVDYKVCVVRLRHLRARSDRALGGPRMPAADGCPLLAAALQTH